MIKRRTLKGFDKWFDNIFNECEELVKAPLTSEIVDTLCAKSEEVEKMWRISKDYIQDNDTNYDRWDYRHMIENIRDFSLYTEMLSRAFYESGLFL